MFGTYDDWKTHDDTPTDREFRTCPWCKARHWTDEICGEAEYVEPDPLED